MVPVRKGDDRRLCSMISLRAQNIKVERSLTIINVIQVRMRVVRIIDDHRTTETIAVLGRQVTVVPERPCIGFVSSSRPWRRVRLFAHLLGQERGNYIGTSGPL